MKSLKYYLVLVGLLVSMGCDSFLDVRPSIKLVVPESLSDMEALLDHQDLYGTPTFITLAGDEIYMDDSGFLTRSFLEQRIYTWEVELYDPTDNNFDWIAPYRAIYVANTVLNIGNQLDPVSSQDMELKNTLMGRAYFFRAYYHYLLLEAFSVPYNAQTAATDLGVPLKTDDNVQTIEPRSTVQEVYDQIESDLDLAYQLLPESETRKYKASKRAVDAFRARIYLNMRRYDDALKYASRVVQSQPELLRYEELDSSNDYPFELYNAEVVFHSENLSLGFINASSSYINPDLIELYDENDLRWMFFREVVPGFYRFYSSYSGYYLHFTGLAVDEMRLIIAEVQARNGFPDQSMHTLNELLETRYTSGTFTPYSASTQREALDIVLTERRKQLVYRGIRWSDLRRLNQEPENQTTLTRTIMGETHTLPPNDPRYVFSIPPSEIEQSGIEQNPRQ